MRRCQSNVVLKTWMDPNTLESKWMCHRWNIWKIEGILVWERFEDWLLKRVPVERTVTLTSQQRHIFYKFPMNDAMSCCRCLKRHRVDLECEKCDIKVSSLGHNIAYIKNGVFCTKCGAYSFVKIGHLHKVCPFAKLSRAPRASAHSRRYLDLLLAGRTCDAQDFVERHLDEWAEAQ